ncbi:hypothetical protein [Trueperella pyogenes]|uniref:hypothetical protein n=1 Tax=Trueperella pyogenes TaxID=1661 RepID=UPI00345CE607
MAEGASAAVLSSISTDGPVMMRGRSGFTTPGLSAGFCGTAGLSEDLWSGLPGLAGASGLEGAGAG